MRLNLKASLTKWFVMILIGSFAYLSGYFYGQKTHLKDSQRQMASDSAAIPAKAVDSSH